MTKEQFKVSKWSPSAGSEIAFNNVCRYFGDDNFIRVAHALETLTVLLREIFKKRFNEQVCLFPYCFPLFLQNLPISMSWSKLKMLKCSLCFVWSFLVLVKPAII